MARGRQRLLWAPEGASGPGVGGRNPGPEASLEQGRRAGCGDPGSTAFRSLQGMGGDCEDLEATLCLETLTLCGRWHGVTVCPGVGASGSSRVFPTRLRG